MIGEKTAINLTRMMEQRVTSETHRRNVKTKAHATAGAILWGILGVLVFLVGLGLLVLPMLLWQQEPTLVLIGVAVFLIVAGVFLLVVASNVASGETLDEAAKGGAGFVTMFAKAVRPFARKIKQQSNGD